MNLPRRIDRPTRILAMIVVVAMAAASYRSWRDLERTLRQNEHTRRLLEDVSATLAAIRDSESSQRGYLLTGSETYLEPYNTAAAAVSGLLNRLAEDSTADPAQSATVERMCSLWEAKQAESALTIQLRRDQGLDAAVEVVRSGSGLALMNSIRNSAREISDREYQLMTGHAVDAEAVGFHNLVLTVAGLSGLMLVLLFLHRSVNHGIKAREQILRELNQARQRLQVILMSIGDGVIACDAVGRVTFLNPVADDLTGWSEAEAMDRPVDEIFHILNEESGERIENPVAKVLRTGQIAGPANHTILVGKQGLERPIEDCGAPIRTAHGEVAGVVLVFRDISERRKQEQQIEKWYRTFQHAGFGIALLDREGRTIVEANQAFAAMHGYEPDELAGKPLADFIEDSPASRAEPEDHTVYELSHRRKDGTSFPVIANLTTLRDTKGKPAYRMGYFADISERKRIEADARADQERRLESDERFRGLATALPHLVWSLDARGDLEYTNPLWDEYHGGPISDGFKEGGVWRKLVHPEELDEFLGRWKEALASGNMFETRCRLKRASDGAFRWFLCRAVPVCKDNKIVRWIGSCTDIHQEALHADELKRANEALQRSNEDLEQFAFAASHDLQEPLRMISLYTQLLKEEYDARLDVTARAYVDFAVTGAQRMERLLQDLLAYSRVIAAPVERPELADAGAALEVAIDYLESPIIRTGARIHAGKLPVVAIPSIHLVQLFQNLIGNAIKYHGTRDPEIWIESQAVGRQWRFSVRDNGIGIEPQYAKQIFGVFKRLHGAEYEGTGIGLALCQRIVARNGGRIWLDSKPGEGSTFFFTLPQA